MKNKGFTLIELLAVIVVLAIIALIITPIISKIVGSATIQANMRSVEGHIGNINNNLAANLLNNNYLDDGTYTFDEFRFTNYPISDQIRCSSYEVSKNRVVSAISCMVKEKNYCFANKQVVSCETDNSKAPVSKPDYDDLYLLDLSDTTILEPGYIDTSNGTVVENDRRMRTKKYYSINHEAYTVDITKDYILTIYEYDSDKNYIGYKEFTDAGIYNVSDNAKYFKLSIRAPKATEKSHSNGQWVRFLSSKSVIARLYVGDVGSLVERNANIVMTVPHNVDAVTIQTDIFENSEAIANDIWYALVKNEVYNPNINASKKTYYISGSGDDNNSGLTKDYPKKTIDSFSGISGVNILLEAGYTYNVKSGFTVGGNVSISSYGSGNRPVLSYYRELNHTFTPVSGYSNLYVTDIKDLPDYNGNGDKSDCNIGQLVIDGEVNWKRHVFESSSEFKPTSLTNKKDEKSWSVDYKNGLLYIYTTSDPNNFHIKYAPGVTALSAKKVSNITIKGIEITGAGLHAINFADTTNVSIKSNSFKYIGGSVLTSAGIRYGNAVQIWDSASNVEVSNNIARWIFDTCYTNQGSSSSMMLNDVVFKENIGMYSQWGLETWGDGGKGFSNIEYADNILYHMADITNPNIKMQVSSSGHLYGEAEDADYITYRGGYRYQQVANLAFWCPSESYMPSIHDNIFWGTNRFLVIGTWFNDTIDINTLNNNLFYEDYNLSYNTAAALYKFKAGGSNKYYTSLSNVTTSTTNVVSTHKKSSNYDNTNEKNQMLTLLNKIINK